VAAVVGFGALLAAATPAKADGADTAAAAAAALTNAPIYVSPQAQSLGFAPAGTTLADAHQARIAIVSEDEGNAGPLARQIASQLGDSNDTVGVVLVSPNGVVDFHAVGSSTAYCKGGAEYAARKVLGTVAGTQVTPAALLQSYETELARLPPDRGESSCASALARHADNDTRAWGWMLAAAAVGVLGIGAFAVYVRRTVRARGEQPVRENLPQWITEDGAADEGELDEDATADEGELGADAAGDEGTRDESATADGVALEDRSDEQR
jgi:hypothetical protein